MPFQNLGSFVLALESSKNLIRVKEEVNPVLEITEIATRVAKAGGPALLFENVKGSRFPILINAMASANRVHLALGRSPEEIGAEIGAVAHDIMPPSLSKIWTHRKALKNVLSMKPIKLKTGPVQQNKLEPADLDQLPVAQSWPLDGGAFFTFPLVITKSPLDGKQNMGVYRMQKFSKSQTGMHWQIGKGGGYHYQQAEKLNQPLPLSVAVGADPILMLCGILPLPEGLDEMVFAGFLRGKGTRIISTMSNGLQVPSEAEFVLEGFVPPHERRREGPYGDHFGHYSKAADFPVFHIDRVWHRDNAIFPISVVGKPPQEDQVLGDAVQIMLLPLLKVMHPEISDLWAYQEAGFHNLLAIAVHQRFEKEAIKTGLWAFGEGQLALSKVIILVDPEVNARKFSALLEAIRLNFNPQNDFILLPATAQDTLDFTGKAMNLGSKMIIDATKKKERVINRRSQVNLEKLKSIDSRIKEVKLIEEALLVIQVESGGREILEKMVNFPLINTVSMVAAVSLDIPLNDETLLVWGIFTRFDCHRDSFFSLVQLKGGHPVYSGALMIDATWKTGYPEPLKMTESVVEAVDKKWPRYNLGEFIESPNTANLVVKEPSHSY